MRERRDGPGTRQESKWCEIVWALRNLEERKVNFEETWAIPYEAIVSQKRLVLWRLTIASGNFIMEFLGNVSLQAFFNVFLR